MKNASKTYKPRAPTIGKQYTSPPPVSGEGCDFLLAHDAQDKLSFVYMRGWKVVTAHLGGETTTSLPSWICLRAMGLAVLLPADENLMSP